MLPMFLYVMAQACSPFPHFPYQTAARKCTQRAEEVRRLAYLKSLISPQFARVQFKSIYVLVEQISGIPGSGFPGVRAPPDVKHTITADLVLEGAYAWSSAWHVSAAIASQVCIMAVVMLCYETLGGMRSVAWTDALQGAPQGDMQDAAGPLFACSISSRHFVLVHERIDPCVLEGLSVHVSGLSASC